LRDVVEWYEGRRSLYGVPPPSSEQKYKASTPEASACVTRLMQGLDRYPNALAISRNHFTEKTILDLGCGPLPWSVAFEDCRIIGLDPLVVLYEEAGFPLGEFVDRITFVRGLAEDMPFPSRSFDAVISVNALDHVDDFASAAREICRVLKPQGVFRAEVHYHPPTELEPHSLDDQEILLHLGDLGIEKVRETVPGEPFRDPESVRKIDPGERLVVWANDDARTLLGR
jgi:SAM-dependent methyltransferase